MIAEAQESQSLGAMFVLASAALYATSAVLIKVGYAAGLTLGQVLALRFVFATPLMVAACFVAGQNPLRMTVRRLLVLLAMGGIGYAGQSFTFYTALKTLPASLVALVLYCYPALVALTGWLLLRRTVSQRHVIALIMTFIGVGLVLGAHFQATSGLIVAVICPLIYTAYILIGERVMLGTRPLSAGTLIISGAAITWMIAWFLRGPVIWPPTPLAWSVVMMIVFMPTIGGMVLFLAGLARVGGARAALISTLEPVVTVGLAVLLLGERLAPAQVLGGALVIASVMVIQWPLARKSWQY